MIFLNHSFADADVAELIKNDLTSFGHEAKASMYTDVRDYDTDGNVKRIIHKRRNFSKNSEVVINIISSRFFKSSPTVKELNDSILNKSQKIIILALPDSPIPDYLSAFPQFKLKSNDKNEIRDVVSSISSYINGDRSGISGDITEVNKSENLNDTIDKIKNSMQSGGLTLFCGAGTSYDAGIPTWDKLLENLFEEMLNSMKEGNTNLPYDISTVKASGITKKTSALIIAKYIKNNLKGEFEETLRKALYKDKPTTCKVIDSVIELARPRRDRKAIDSIITFNFDSLFEEQLGQASIAHKAIHSESIKCSPNELPVYHVHGFLPRVKDSDIKSSIVFSEDGYHSQFIDPYSWSNIIQIQKLTQNTCLFIGISLTDPNMRRLLDVAWRKTSDDTASHFIIKKKPATENADAKKFVMYLDEQDANELGLNVIWVNDYNEIPGLLKSFLG